MSDYLDVVFQRPMPQIYTYHNPFDQPCGMGFRVEAPLGKGEKNCTGWVVGQSQKKPEISEKIEIKEIDRILDEEPFFGERQWNLARWMAAFYLCSPGEALATILPSGGKGGKKRTPSESSLLQERGTDSSFSLTSQQRRVMEEVTEKEEGFCYLYGPPGSGKTEVLLECAKRILKEGGGVIFLLPEIALTHQLLAIAEKRLGCEIAILHSRLTGRQRLRTWQRLLKGELSFVMGARSAIFAPVTPLKLIILDEEHEGGYKSDVTPRYHGRQIAMRLARTEKARLIMGSATPSVEAWHFMERGDLPKLTLKRRAEQKPVQEITLVDMRKEERILSAPLLRAITATRDEGRQVLLFLNRRGFAHFLYCGECGLTLKCPHCAVGMTYHKKRNTLMCHYCGQQQGLPKSCPNCSSLGLSPSSFGTERVEEEIKRIFPTETVRRLDSDVAQKKGAFQSTLKEFFEGSISILLGTQMVAKGLNFPHLGLVGVVLADTGLAMPDFRASERTFALLTQVTGRAGRYSSRGRIVIQSLDPGQEVIQLATQGEIEAFYRRELALRKCHSFPPYGRLLRLVFRGEVPEKVEKAAKRSASQLQGIPFTEILGPSECPIGKISGKTRHHIILQTAQLPTVRRELTKWRRSFRPSGEVYIEIDVDPLALL